jgi:hypothetical protein
VVAAPPEDVMDEAAAAGDATPIAAVAMATALKTARMTWPKPPCLVTFVLSDIARFVDESVCAFTVDHSGVVKISVTGGEVV